MGERYYRDDWDSKEERWNFFADCWKSSDSKHIDKLDCSVSLRRVLTDMTFEEFERLYKTAETNGVLIDWKYTRRKNRWTFDIVPIEYYEIYVRFSPVGSEIDLFGWVDLPVEKGEELFDEYRMKEYQLCLQV